MSSRLRSREFEPDAPNYTPRISGIMHIENGSYNYAMSILKSNNGNPDSCQRFTFAYDKPSGRRGTFHPYLQVRRQSAARALRASRSRSQFPDDMDAFTELLWNSLNEDNKVSLFVRYIDIATGNI